MMKAGVCLTACLEIAAALLLLALVGWSQERRADEQIDWQYARKLLRKEQRGEQLAPEEKEYLDRAKKEIARGRGPGRVGNNPGQGPRPEPREKTGMKPLDEMTAADRYKDQDGGLYGGGKNVPPDAHVKAARAALARIAPLDDKGKPAGDRRIVLVSIGMSNTTGEFQVFKKIADADDAKGPRLTIVDGAQGGRAAPAWTGKWGNFKVWEEVDRRLKTAGVTPQQVQVLWIKQAIPSPANLGAFPRHAEELKDCLVTILNVARQRYPNLRLAYLSSRIYAGYATVRLNPEPYAYEGAFAVRWVIQDQIKGEPKLNHDAAKGEVKAPVVLWGPYLWADGTTARKSDGLVWNANDFVQDGTHPSIPGRMKVAKMLLNFFKTDPLARDWFVKQGRSAP